MIMKRTVLFGLLLALVITAVPMAAMTPAAEAGSGHYGGQQCVYHTVTFGQTLSGIASYYGVNMWTLAQRNGIW
ncbi:MAG: LysM peptidoglycan-binding domain-containing protein, partial [Anaerolineae bacterium]|nr:LysM peptidoglycan-binding domain-containing protein [Anaerolineae bacterium]